MTEIILQIRVQIPEERGRKRFVVGDRFILDFSKSQWHERQDKIAGTLVCTVGDFERAYRSKRQYVIVLDDETLISTDSMQLPWITAEGV